MAKSADVLYSTNPHPKKMKSFGQNKIKRDAFLYLEPKPPKNEFAQCASCMMFTGSTCTIHGPDVEITKEMSCGLYVHGEPMPEEEGHEMVSVTPEESGLYKGPVRCENCRYGEPKGTSGGGLCSLYSKLNMMQDFDLDVYINVKGCCNAFKKGK